MWFANLKTYWRFLGNNKLYTLVTVLGFAVSLMFVLLLSIYVKQELSVDQFHEKKDRIYLLARSDNDANFPNPVADLLKNNFPEIESYTRVVHRQEMMKALDKDVNVRFLLADSAFFSIFSFPLIEGDPSTVLSTRASAVISRSFARQYFFDEDPIGKSLYFSDGEKVMITGIMKDFSQNTQFPNSDMVLNYHLLDRYYDAEGYSSLFENWRNRSFEMFFLAKEGTDLPAKAPLLADLFSQNNFNIHKSDGSTSDAIFVPLTDCYFSGIHTTNAGLKRNSKTPVLVYTTIALLILIIAILNYINLSVSQAGLRGKEAAMRRLLGCNKKGLMLQFLSEAMLMTVLSFAIGIFLAFLAEPFFNEVLNTKLNLADQLLSIPVVAAALLSLFIIGLISGWVPAVVVSKFQPIDVVKGAYLLKIKSTYSKLLITFQYLVGITLLICSTFIVRQNSFIRSYNLGVSKDNISVIYNQLEMEKHAALRDRLEGIAGVDKVGFSSHGVPVSSMGFRSSGFDGQYVGFNMLELDSAAFKMYGIKIVRPAEETASSKTIYFNQKAFDLFQPDSANSTIRKEYDVPHVGITENFHFSSLSQEVGPIIIELNNDLFWASFISVKINAAADLFETAEEIKRVYSEFNGGDTVYIQFADDMVQEWYEKEEKAAKLLSAFTMLTFVILLMGIFAMSLYYVRQREKEIALRKVNGATEFEIMRMLNYNFMRWILIAFVIAVPIAYYAMTKWLEGFAYKTPLDWWVFALTGGVVVALSIISISVQSWHAATANPIDSIKSE